MRELWRYPVKSLSGERIERSRVLPGIGLPGDRGWAIRDEEAREIRSAKKWPALLGLCAEYLEEPEGELTPPVRVGLPDRGSVDTTDSDLDERISAVLGRDVTLHPRVPAEQRAHYRRSKPIADMAAEIRETSELLPDEPLPVLSEIPADFAELVEHVTPPGTYFDFFELHLLTTASLDTLSSLAKESAIDVRRFRPNLLIEGAVDGASFPEFDWCGHGIAIGALELQIVMPMMRCAMTTYAQGELPKDPAIMRALVRESGMNLGVGAQVLAAGEVAVGDELVLFDL